MKSNDSPEIFSIRLDSTTRSLLDHRAKQRNMPLGKYIRLLLDMGVEKENELSSKKPAYTKLEKILLKNSIETLMLVNVIVDIQNVHYSKEVKEKSGILLKQILEEP